MSTPQIRLKVFQTGYVERVARLASAMDPSTPSPGDVLSIDAPLPGDVILLAQLQREGARWLVLGEKLGHFAPAEELTTWSPIPREEIERAREQDPHELYQPLGGWDRLRLRLRLEPFDDPPAPPPPEQEEEEDDDLYPDILNRDLPALHEIFDAAVIDAVSDLRPARLAYLSTALSMRRRIRSEEAPRILELADRVRREPFAALPGELGDSLAWLFDGYPSDLACDAWPSNWRSDEGIDFVLSDSPAWWETVRAREDAEAALVDMFRLRAARSTTTDTATDRGDEPEPDLPLMT